MRAMIAGIGALILGLLIALSPGLPTAADHDMTCHGSVGLKPGARYYLNITPMNPVTMNPATDRGTWGPRLMVQVGTNGDATAHGIVLTELGTTGGRRVLQPASTQAACADLDNDGIAGISAVEVELDGGFVLTILASESDIDGGDPVVVTAELRGDDTTRTRTVTARLAGPARRGR